MNNRELKIKLISNEFAKWQVQIENLNSLNLYDANIFSEHTLCELLNLVFDYKLVNANLLQSNFPAVDLVDGKNKVAIQVTSTKTKDKMQSTLNKFVEKKLYLKYDELLIVILGAKQKSYSALGVSSDFSFDTNEHILDFKSLLRIIAKLPLNRIEKIAALLDRENVKPSVKKRTNNIAAIKRKLSLKKKIQKDFILEVDKKDWNRLRYEPFWKFVYHNVIIRSVDDKSWPNVDEVKDTPMSSWIKGEFHNLYENGIELITHGGYVLVDEEGNWDLMDWPKDKRENNPAYSKLSCHAFLRIPYEYIVDYDLDPDDYYSLPTIYVEYAKDGTPYEEIRYGRGGHYDEKSPANSRYPYYLDNALRKKLR